MVPNDQPQSRRKVLAGIASLGAAGLAGCVGGGSDEAAQTATSTPTATPTATEESAYDVDGDLTVDAGFTGDVASASGVVTIASGVEFDGAIDSGEGVVVEKNAVVTGRVQTFGDVTVQSKATVDGTIEGQHVTVGDEAHVKGGITANGTLTVGKAARVDGTASSSQKLVAKTNAVFNDFVGAGLKAQIGEGVTIAQTLSADSATVASGATIDGGALVTEQLTTKADVTFGSDVTGNGGVDLGTGNEVQGDVSSKGAVVIGANSLVTGDVSGKTVDLGSDVTVEGTVSESSSK
ncbi:MAG: polymer-forming cytoskeletal protein [Halopenitus sp.]